MPVAAAAASPDPDPVKREPRLAAVPAATPVPPVTPRRHARPLQAVPALDDAHLAEPPTVAPEAPALAAPPAPPAAVTAPGPRELLEEPVELAPRSHRKPKSKFAGLPSPTTLVAGAAVIAVATGTVAAAGGGATVDTDGEHVAQALDTPILVAPAPEKSEAQLRAEAEAARERAVKASRARARAALEARKQAAAELKRKQELARKAAEAARLRAARILELAKSFRLPVRDYRLTAHFGEWGLWSNGHTGLDFACSYGTPIRAVASGTIVSAGWDGAYGWKTVIRLKDGTEHWYAHQASFVKRHGWVNAGDIIGRVGTTGRSSGPHLHFEVRINDEPVNPLTWLRARGLHP